MGDRDAKHLHSLQDVTSLKANYKQKGGAHGYTE